ncbi:hypothetical protein HU200_014679 [Digitaria exilis]|uniref:Uncharacterized protein n=1 Tax=Digitaria exilis TaxID=1010633 RepID=A0A835KK36_9POAL|nr:hypothetical protein HU200_014679 [Digitaria exilis]
MGPKALSVISTWQEISTVLANPLFLAPTLRSAPLQTSLPIPAPLQTENVRGGCQSLVLLPPKSGSSSSLTAGHRSGAPHPVHLARARPEHVFRSLLRWPARRESSSPAISGGRYATPQPPPITSVSFASQLTATSSRSIPGAMDDDDRRRCGKAPVVTGFPDDPLVEIFSRRVSKAWRDLIDDPLHRCKLRQTLEGLFHEIKDSRRRDRGGNYEAGGDNLRRQGWVGFVDLLGRSSCLAPTSESIRLMDICHGLLLLDIGGYRIDSAMASCACLRLDSMAVQWNRDVGADLFVKNWGMD